MTSNGIAKLIGPNMSPAIELTACLRGNCSVLPEGGQLVQRVGQQTMLQNRQETPGYWPFVELMFGNKVLAFG